MSTLVLFTLTHRLVRLVAVFKSIFVSFVDVCIVCLCQQMLSLNIYLNITQYIFLSIYNQIELNRRFFFIDIFFSFCIKKKLKNRDVDYNQLKKPQVHHNVSIDRNSSRFKNFTSDKSSSTAKISIWNS